MENQPFRFGIWAKQQFEEKAAAEDPARDTEPIRASRPLHSSFSLSEFVAKHYGADRAFRRPSSIDDVAQQFYRGNPSR